MKYSAASNGKSISYFRDNDTVTSCNHALDKCSKKMRIGEVANCRKCGKEFERVA